MGTTSATTSASEDGYLGISFAYYWAGALRGHDIGNHLCEQVGIHGSIFLFMLGWVESELDFHSHFLGVSGVLLFLFWWLIAVLEEAQYVYPASPHVAAVATEPEG